MATVHRGSVVIGQGEVIPLLRFARRVSMEYPSVWAHGSIGPAELPYMLQAYVFDKGKRPQLVLIGPETFWYQTDVLCLYVEQELRDIAAHYGCAVIILDGVRRTWASEAVLLTEVEPIVLS